MFSKSLCLFLVWNIVSDGYGQQAEKFFRTDYSYMEAFKSFYKIHTIPQTWSDAKQICAVEGGILWHPDNDDEAKSLIAFWNETNPKIQWVYLGLSDLLAEGIFETVDGKSVSEVYNNWEPDQPNDIEGQDCVLMHLHGNGELDDYSCDNRYSFLCKKTLQSLEWNHQCNMPYIDYTYNKNNGKCYKLYTTPLNWIEAYALCQLQQSYLAVVNNREEADFLANLAESTPKPKPKGNYSRGIYHLGFHNKYDDGWRTVKGTPLSIDLKSWYENYQPDDESHGQCGSMFFNGRLINTDCDSKSYFICEHEVDNGSAVNSFTGSERPILTPYFGGGFED